MKRETRFSRRDCPNGWKCPYCGICNPKEATRCGNCGR